MRYSENVNERYIASCGSGSAFPNKVDSVPNITAVHIYRPVHLTQYTHIDTSKKIQMDA